MMCEALRRGDVQRRADMLFATLTGCGRGPLYPELQATVRTAIVRIGHEYAFERNANRSMHSANIYQVLFFQY